MFFDSDLCHANERLFIVKVRAFDNNTNYGSALGEGSSVEEAENRAIDKMLSRIRNEYPEHKLNNASEKIVAKEINIKTPKPDVKNSNNNLQNKQNDDTTKDTNSIMEEIPDDWSDALTEIEANIKRLGWNKNKENEFLNQSLGITNRTKITDYNIMIMYLKTIKDIKNDSTYIDGIKNLKRDSLIEKSNIIIKQIGWTNQQARSLLMERFNVNTRNSLSTEDLNKFIDLLNNEPRDLTVIN